MSFHRGQFVRITFAGQTIDGTVMIVSPNNRSLMLSFDGALHTPGGGMVFGALPALMDDDGVYRDLVEGEPVQVVPRVVQ